MPGPGLLPKPELQPAVKSHSSRMPWLCNDAARPPSRIVRRQADAKPAVLQLGDRLACTGDQRGVGSATTAKDALDGRSQLWRVLNAGMDGEGCGDIVVVARRKRRPRSYAICLRIVPAEAQKAVRQPLIAASGMERSLTVDRHPGAPIVDDGAVLVEQNASDRSRHGRQVGRSGGAHRAVLGSCVNGKVVDGRRRARKRIGRIPGHLDLGEAGSQRIVEQAAAPPGCRRCRRSPSAPRWPARCR